MSATGISISGTAASASPKSIGATAAAIIGIFVEGYETHQDQATIQQALRVLEKATGVAPGVSDLTVRDSSIRIDDRNDEDDE